jgi:hypothetical protein
MRRFRSLPRSLGWPLALLIVVVVSAGSATAARKLTGKDVADSSLTGADVRNSSLSGADIRNRSLTARDFRESIRGPAGPTGPQGPQGQPGRNLAQLSGQGVTDPPVILAAGETQVAKAYCPANTLAISGGYASTGGLIVVTQNLALNDPQGDYWQVSAVNVDGGGNPAALIAIAYCGPTGLTDTAFRRRVPSLTRFLHER